MSATLPEDAGPRCDACKGKGWVPNDDVPRAVCGTCNGTGFPQSWAAQEISRLDAEVSRMRTALTRISEAVGKRPELHWDHGFGIITGTVYNPEALADALDPKVLRKALVKP